MPNGAKNWCFTLNNFTPNDENHLSKLFDDHGETSGLRYLIFQQEVGEKGTPHLQGYISFGKRVSLSRLKALVSDRAAFFVAKGSPSQNREYCSKSKTAIEGTCQEYGTIPVSERSRTDLDGFKDAVDNGLVSNKRQAMSDFSGVYAKYPRFVHDYLQSRPRQYQIEDHSLNKWQSDMSEMLQVEPDDRKITFVVDKEGNKGKTWFCKWYVQHNQLSAQILEPAKKSDMAYSLMDDLRVLFVNVTRTQVSANEGNGIDYLYSFLESVKDGVVFSPKYESTTRVLSQKVHVVVMMNSEPKRDAMSKDRYDVIYI